MWASSAPGGARSDGPVERGHDPMSPPVIALETLARVRGHLPEMSPEEARMALVGLGGQVRERCQTDIGTFGHFVRTRDEADPVTPVKPLPMQLDYLRRLLDLLASAQRLATVKSPRSPGSAGA